MHYDDDPQMDDDSEYESPEERKERLRKKFNKEPSEDTNTQKSEREENTDSQNQESPANDTGWKKIIKLYNSGENGTTSEANQRAAEKFIAEYHPKTVKDSGKSDNDDTIYYYDESSGYYVDDGKYKFYEVMEENLRQEFTNTRKYEILPKIRQNSYIDREELDAPDNMVCVENGVLDLSNPSNPELKPHSPEYTFTSKLNAPYHEGVRNEKFETFVHESVNDGDIRKLQEYTADALRHWEQPSNLCVILGPTDAGKGVYQRVMERIFGEDNSAGKSLRQISEEERHKHALRGTMLNVKSELSTKILRGSNVIKRISGDGDKISANPKYKETFDFVPTANHLFSANQVPRVQRTGESFYGRWLFVTFPETVPPEEQNQELENELTGDEQKMAGILNWLLDGYQRKHDRNGTGYHNERSIEEKEEQWEAYGNSIDRFIKTCLDMEDSNNSDVLPKKDIHAAYKRMCEDVNLKPEEQGELSKYIGKKSGVNDTNPTQNSSAINPKFDESYRVSCFAGVSLTERGHEYFDDVLTDLESEEEKEENEPSTEEF